MSGWRNVAWLVDGMAVAFLVAFVVDDSLGLHRDIYYAVYVAAVVAVFIGWAHDAGQSLTEQVARRWRLALALGLLFAGISVLIALRAAEGSSAHPGGLTFAAAIGWRGLIYGAVDGLLLSAFPILLVFAAQRDSRPPRRRADRDRRRREWPRRGR